MKLENMFGINDLIPYLISPPPPFDQWVAITKTIFIVVSLFFFFWVVYFISKTSWLQLRALEDTVEFFTYQPFGARKIVKQWNKIKHRLETGLESESKLVIIEADSMLNDVLEKIGFVGENLEERLKHLTSASLSNIEEVWDAHKIRNNIVYDPDYRLNLDEAKKIISIYEKALVSLQAL